MKKRPLYLGLSTLLSGVGSLLIAAPHFFGRGGGRPATGGGGANSSSSPFQDLCSADRVARCGGEEGESTAAKDIGSLVVIFAGIFLVREQVLLLVIIWRKG